VVSIVEPDLGISSKLLQLVNSAFFSLPREMVSLHEAVAYLGLENVRAVATSVLFEVLGGGTRTEQLAVRLQAHSMGVMQLTRHILPHARRPSELFLGALLHDLGLLAAAALVPDVWAGLADAGTGPWTLDKKSSLLGATHANIGAYLLCLWGMSYRAVEIVGRHHDPGEATTGCLDEVQAVYLAEALFAEIEEVPGHDWGSTTGRQSRWGSRPWSVRGGSSVTK
jgi:HD-like signal output (HDOD) protein